MAQMKRGANVSLTREVPGLTGLVLGARWNAGSETALADNMTMATILCGADGRALSDQHFVFFNQLTTPDLSVQQLTEALDGDNEQVEVDLGGVPAQVERIVIVVYVNPGPAHRRTLGQLRSCIVRVLNLNGNAELTSCRTRPGSRSARCTGTTASGSSRCSARATRRASRGSPRITG
jgi:tellurium resistance protein TerD